MKLKTANHRNDGFQKLTMAEEEAKRIQEENYRKSMESGSVRKSKRLMSFSSQPRIKTNNLLRLHNLFWVGESDGSESASTASSDENDCTEDSTSSTSSTSIQLDGEEREGEAQCSGGDNNNSYVKVSPRLRLKRIHCSPNIYTIDNFVTEVELNYLRNKIQTANEKKLFQKSFIDDSTTTTTTKCPKKRIIQNNNSRKRQRSSSENPSNDSNRIEINFDQVSSMNIACTDADTNANTNTNSSSSTKNDNEHQHSNEQRTSQFIHFAKQSDSIITSIEQRACELLSLPNENIEPLQLVKYDVGQYFNVHHDLGILYDDGSVELPQRTNALLSPPRRIVTILVYLNDVESCHGGSTQFPLLKPKQDHSNKCNMLSSDPQDRDDRQCLEIIPKKGMALVWCNITKDGLPDTRVVHSGQPLLSNKEKHTHEKEKLEASDSKNKEEDGSIAKYAMNIWACEY